MCTKEEKKPRAQLECFCGKRWWVNAKVTKLIEFRRVDYNSPCCDLQAKYIVTFQG